MTSDVRPLKSGHRRTGGQSLSTKKTNYLELDSDYLGDLAYDIELPVPLADYKHLQYPLAPEVFCGYRPTTLEFQSLLQLVSLSDIGPNVDLIDPVSAYPVRVPPAPAPEDAALLVGLIPGVERHLIPGQQHEHSSQEIAEVRVEVATIRGTRKNAVETIIDQFNTHNYIHPLKPHLKPVKIIQVLPHARLWTNQYIHASLQQVDRVSLDRPLVLKNLENVSQRLRNFALYEPRQTINKAETTSIQTEETHKPSQSADEGYLDGEYQFVRDYIARFPEDQTFSNNLLFDLPDDFQNPEGSKSPAYFLPLRGPKLLFTRASSAHGDKDKGKKIRTSLRLSARPPTDAELEDEKRKLEVLQKVDFPTLALQSESGSFESQSSSSSLEPEETYDKLPNKPKEGSRGLSSPSQLSPQSQSKSQVPVKKRLTRRKASSTSESSGSFDMSSSDGSDDDSDSDSSSIDESSVDSSQS